MNDIQEGQGEVANVHSTRPWDDHPRLEIGSGVMLWRDELENYFPEVLHRGHGGVCGYLLAQGVFQLRAQPGNGQGSACLECESFALQHEAREAPCVANSIGSDRVLDEGCISSRWGGGSDREFHKCDDAQGQGAEAFEGLQGGWTNVLPGLANPGGLFQGFQMPLECFQ